MLLKIQQMKKRKITLDQWCRKQEEKKGESIGEKTIVRVVRRPMSIKFEPMSRSKKVLIHARVNKEMVWVNKDMKVQA